MLFWNRTPPQLSLSLSLPHTHTTTTTTTHTRFTLQASLGVPAIMADSHYAVSPHYSLLCNDTQDPTSWYCTQAVSDLRTYTNLATPLSEPAVLDASNKSD